MPVREASYEAVLEWWSCLDDETRASELDDFAMEFAFHSARIEGAELTYEEAREVYEDDSVTAYTGDVRSLVSLIDQRAAFGWMLGVIEERRPLTEELLLTLHRTLTYLTYSKKLLADDERPGKYKLSDYIVRGTYEVGAAPDQCPQLTRDLLAEVDKELPRLTPSRALTVAAYLHNNLVSIHPFAEGTGRTARDLMNLVLLEGDHPPIIVFDDDANRYYGALEEFDQTGDLAPFKDFLKRETVRSWEDRMR